MPVPAADSAVPLAVLVLAWDETTPAVRALVEATQASASTVKSILLMVPQAANPNVLSAEEYLPLAPVPPLGEAPLDKVSSLPPATTAFAAAEPATAALDEGAPSSKANKAVLPLAAAAPLAWSAVRVLRLGSLSLNELSQRAGQALPAPIWLGPATAPAAPYQGATAEPSQPAASASALPETAPISGVEIVGPARTAAPVAATASPQYAPTEPLGQGADLEADLLPIEEEELAYFELATAEAPALLAGFEDPFSAPQAGWAGALASLQQPKPAAPAAPTPPPAVHAAGAGLPARPVASQYEAPDLNFRIIQYARFAVPVALAEAPYAAIYAPAWPTWLAAQELRQRTGGPLVLHVTTLAAGADESLDTATSWMAELQRQALRRADVVLAETPALAQRLRQDLDLPASTVHTVPAADAAAIAQALRAARPRPAATVR